MALEIFNGLFSHILDHLVNFKGDLCALFERTLQHDDLEIKLSALKATINYLGCADRKDTKDFEKLIPFLAQVVTKGLEEDDETVIEDAMIEFNDLVELEPGFFKPTFAQLYQTFKPIIGKSDFCNATLRQLPLEFAVSMIERKPSLVKKDIILLKDILEQTFQLMIDIDQDIDESWMKPKEGFVGEDEDEDNVSFGKTQIDRLIATIGDEIMLPLIGELVQNTVANDDDWRYKHAGIMAFSQVGEYVDDPSKIGVMIPVVLQACSHQNPMIRYAALHCIGQLSDDMPNDYQKVYGQDSLPVVIACLDDSVARVQSHACASLTNFIENATSEMMIPFMQTLSEKFCVLLQSGISMVKENAATALATLVEKVGEAFIPYFTDSLQFLINILSSHVSAEYKQLRGQVIEAITIICAAVGLETFKPAASDVIGILQQIQDSQLDKKDSQRVYLLSAWQRICLLMKADFAPYLPQVLPGVFNMATLNPEMGVAGQDNLASLTDVLREVTPSNNNDEEKNTNVVTDEIEEKDIGIQMLAVFIDEVGEACYDYVEQISKILLSVTDYSANDSIRASAAIALPGLIKAAKARGVAQE